MHIALIPAAGQSKRMGQPKLSLPLGSSTVIEMVIHTLRSAGAEHILVVVGPHVPQLASLAKAAGASFLCLAHETADMRQTVEEGLNWIEANWRPMNDDGFLLVPADHPVMDVGVVQTLLSSGTRSAPETLRVAANQERLDISIPTFNGKRGHPTLIGWRHVAGILALPAHLGLNSYLRQHSDSIREVAVDSESILFDMDTPEDYDAPDAPRFLKIVEFGSTNARRSRYPWKRQIHQSNSAGTDSMDEYLYLILLSRPGESEARFKDRLSVFWTHVLREHPEDFEKVYAEKTSFERQDDCLARTYLIEESAATNLDKHLREKEMDFEPIDPADIYSKYEAAPPDWFWIEH